MKDIQRLEKENQELAESLMKAFEQTEILRNQLVSELESVTKDQMDPCLR
jgi:hypothetical protein